MLAGGGVRCLASLLRTFPVTSRLSQRCLASVSAWDAVDSNDSNIWGGLTDEQQEFRLVAAEFAKKELLPFSAKWDSAKHFPVDVLRSAAQLGFGGICVGEDVGGSSLGRADAAVIFEALAYGDISVTAYLTIHNMVANCIDKYVMSEPGSGSDAASLRATARRDGDCYVLDGAKAFISGGGVSDVYLVLARTGQPGPKGISAFLVRKGTAGLSFGKPEEKLGWNAQPTCAVVMDKVRVPAHDRLGEEGAGFRIAMNALNGGRINIAACSIGGAQFCLDTTQEYVQNRVQFDKPIASFQNTAFKIADMATDVQASRLMVRHAAQSLDNRFISATMDAAMAKRFATDACYRVADQALQLHGGYGYLKDYPVERVLRDLRVHSILEGTNEVMRLIIAREMHKHFVAEH